MRPPHKCLSVRWQAHHQGLVKGCQPLRLALSLRHPPQMGGRSLSPATLHAKCKWQR